MFQLFWMSKRVCCFQRDNVSRRTHMSSLFLFWCQQTKSERTATQNYSPASWLLEITQMWSLLGLLHEHKSGGQKKNNLWQSHLCGQPKFPFFLFLFVLVWRWSHSTWDPGLMAVYKKNPTKGFVSILSCPVGNWTQQSSTLFTGLTPIAIPDQYVRGGLQREVSLLSMHAPLRRSVNKNSQSDLFTNTEWNRN